MYNKKMWFVLLVSMYTLTLASCEGDSGEGSSTAHGNTSNSMTVISTESVSDSDNTETVEKTTVSLDTSKSQTTVKVGTTKIISTTTKTTTTTSTGVKVLMPETTIKANYGGVRYMDYANVRTKMSNTIYKLLHEKKLSIGYIGGSVTDGYGASSPDKSWRIKTELWMRSAFPDAKINVTKASIGGTGSGLAMYRIDNDLLQRNPDLIFIEFACNDAYERYTTNQIKTQIETIYRKIYAKNPYAEIIMVYVSDNGNNSAKTIPAHEEIAERYQVNSIRVDSAISDVIKDEKKSFSNYFIDGVHPNDKGYGVYSDTIISYLQSELKGASAVLKSKTLPSPLAATKMSARLYRAVDTTLSNASGWTKDTTKFSWLGPVYGGCITANARGSQFTVKFKGTDFGIFFEKGSDIGVIRYSVDGGEEKTMNGYLANTNPSQYMLANDLANGEHTITLSLDSTGKRFAIAAFLVAGTIIK